VGTAVGAQHRGRLGRCRITGGVDSLLALPEQGRWDVFVAAVSRDGLGFVAERDPTVTSLISEELLASDAPISSMAARILGSRVLQSILAQPKSGALVASDAGVTATNVQSTHCRSTGTAGGWAPSRKGVFQVVSTGIVWLCAEQPIPGIVLVGSQPSA